MEINYIYIKRPNRKYNNWIQKFTGEAQQHIGAGRKKKSMNLRIDQLRLPNQETKKWRKMNRDSKTCGISWNVPKHAYQQSQKVEERKNIYRNNGWKLSKFNNNNNL